MHEFAAFLKDYVNELSFAHSADIVALAKEAEKQNPRLREPLFLYAHFTEQGDALLKAVTGTKLFHEYEQMMSHGQKIEELLRSGSPDLPLGYRKVWSSYIAYKARSRGNGEALRLSYEEFKKHIDAIAAQAALQDGIDELVLTFNNKQSDQVNLFLPSLATNLVELLERIMGDKYEWISYWVWELNFGKKYHPGCVTDENGKDIKLETVKDLYCFLEQNDREVFPL